MIPYGRHDISAQDIEDVISVLQSDFLTQGPLVPTFERRVVDYCGAGFGVATSSATSALHLACASLGLGVGDLLWTSPITFVASANCARYCGADVDFVDIDPRTYNISADALEVKLTDADRAGRLPKILVPVHLSGQSCDMRRIHELAQQFGVKIVEDASHAIGGRYRDSVIGSCEFSDIVVFSFHPVKIITTAEGGMALTNDAELADRMSLLRSHGITRNEAKMTCVPDGQWYYEQIDLGFNYRVTEIQAALGISQMKRLDAFVLRRHEIAEQYDRALDALPIVRPWMHPDAFSAYHLYIVRLDLTRISKPHRDVFDSLRSQGIGVNLHYIPVYRQPYYSKMGFDRVNFPEAEAYYAEAITLPLFPTMSDQDQIVVIDALKTAILE